MSDWTPHQDTDGNTYYYNNITGESSWELPSSDSTTTTATSSSLLSSLKASGTKKTEKIFSSRVRATFRFLDADMDGEITLEELKAVLGEEHAKYYMENIDHYGDQSGTCLRFSDLGLRVRNARNKQVR